MLQRLGHVLANLAQRGAAAAGAHGRRRMHEALARQVIRQRTARRPLAFKTFERGETARRLGAEAKLDRVRARMVEVEAENARLQDALKRAAHALEQARGGWDTGCGWWRASELAGAPEGKVVVLRRPLSPAEAPDCQPCFAPAERFDPAVFGAGAGRFDHPRTW